jgi:hypothetical protein
MIFTNYTYNICKLRPYNIFILIIWFLFFIIFFKGQANKYPEDTSYLNMQNINFFFIENDNFIFKRVELIHYFLNKISIIISLMNVPSTLLIF